MFRRVQGRASAQAAAFSLVEMLIVAAVVGILAALVAGALTRSQRRTREAVCLSNLRQIHIGFSVYLNDNEDRFPEDISWNGMEIDPREFVGGGDPRLAKYPPARVRPLYSHPGGEGVFACPEDAGYDASPAGGPTALPTVFEELGSSYWYNSGEIIAVAGVETRRGLAVSRLTDLARPANYLLMYDPPASGGSLNNPGGISVFWHRAKRPGSGPASEERKRGPRYASLLFVDGHATLLNCTGIQGFPYERHGVAVSE